MYIAQQQWKTNAHKLKLSLYDRRFKVFEAAREILGLMYTSGVRDTQLLDFLTTTADAEFLFGREIKEYLKEIYRHVQALISANSQNECELGSSCGGAFADCGGRNNRS